MRHRDCLFVSLRDGVSGRVPATVRLVPADLGDPTPWMRREARGYANGVVSPALLRIAGEAARHLPALPASADRLTP